MKKAVSKSTILPNKNVKNIQKNELSTGVNSHQRSHLSSTKLKQQKVQSSNPINTLKNEQKMIKAQQLYNIIETFYCTLCDLPLEKLINSSDPNFWISEQEETYKGLAKKLERLQKGKNHEYYCWKLKSVQIILSNIKENLQTLSRISHMKNYCSGASSSNYNSRQNSLGSIQSRELKLGHFNCQNDKMKEMLSYDQYVIDNKSQSSFAMKKSRKRSQQLMAQTVNSEEEDSEGMDSQKLIRSEIQAKKKRQRHVPNEGQNRNELNFPKNNLENKSKYTYSRTGFDTKDKTLQKLTKILNNTSQKTSKNYIQEPYFLEDHILNINQEQTKRSQLLQQQQQHEQEKNIQSFNSKHSKEKEAEYLQMIKELKMELVNKDKELEKLLINQQEYDQSIEILSQHQKQKNKEVLFLKESLAVSNREKQKMQQEIRRIYHENEDLKETVRFQRERTKKQERQKQKIQQKIDQFDQQKQQLLSTLQKIKQQNKSLRKNERIMKQKQQIYTKKYFKLYNQLQSIKENEKTLMKQFKKYNKQKTGQSQSYEQIKHIIEYHKNKIFNESQL